MEMRNGKVIPTQEEKHELNMRMRVLKAMGIFGELTSSQMTPLSTCRDAYTKTHDVCRALRKLEKDELVERTPNTFPTKWRYKR